MILLLLLFLPSLLADSIILVNDCKRTSEKCFITLEVIKGEAKKDCAIFGTVDRYCALGETETPTETAPTDEEIEVKNTEDGTIVSWTGNKGSESNSLSASSVWQRLTRRKRQVRGKVVNCTCTPVRRQRRSAGIAVRKSNEIQDTKSDCNLGFHFTGRRIQPTTETTLRTESNSRLADCARLCHEDSSCLNFAFSIEQTVDNCILLGKALEDKSEEKFTVYERC